MSIAASTTPSPLPDIYDISQVDIPRGDRDRGVAGCVEVLDHVATAMRAHVTSLGTTREHNNLIA